MMFVFAYIAQSMGWSHDQWPLRLIYGTEVAFIVVTFVCIVLAVRLRGTASPARDAVAFFGGVSASFGLIMPFELAPMFFHARGEIMMATMGLILVYPVAAVGFVFAFAKSMKVDDGPPTSITRMR